ncbi:hypothetical protein ACLIND_003456 [Vibrio cholerae]
MAEKNKYGLGRYVPSDVRRIVRQRCGFGCVICGLSLYDYEHFAPDFKDAKFHDPDGITLLCMQCNQKRNRKVLSVESVIRANENPKCLSQGFANEAFDFGSDPIEVQFAGVSFIECPTLIEVDGISVLSIKNPSLPNEPYLLSGRFCDDAGEATLKIEDNVWSVGADCWDVECEGATITIRKDLGNIVLELRSEPPHKLVVERLDMEFEGVYFKGNKEELKVSFDNKNWSTWSGCSMTNCTIGMSFRTA